MTQSYFTTDEFNQIARILSSVFEVDRPDMKSDQMLRDFIEALENGDTIILKEENNE